MGHASWDLIFRAAGALLLLAALLPTAAMAAEEGWAPVVKSNVSKAGQASEPAYISKAQRVLTMLPPLPEPKPASVKKVPPTASHAPAAPPQAEVPPNAQPGAADIVTGSIDSIESTRMLSPTDKARLFAEDAPSDALITGAVDAPSSDLARGYCVNIASAATDARIALQRAKLAEAERQITQRIATLEAKSAEYKAWVERRDEFLKRASAALVKIYTQMEPDAAALQLVAMDEETASALLTKLEPQNASAILNEMAPERAARLAAGIAGAARLPQTAGFPPATVRQAAQRGQGPTQANPGEDTQ
jgi:flagellar motility protein MotE (MotC chaperone)